MSSPTPFLDSLIPTADEANVQPQAPATPFLDSLVGDLPETQPAPTPQPEKPVRLSELPLEAFGLRPQAEAVFDAPPDFNPESRPKSEKLLLQAGRGVAEGLLKDVPMMLAHAADLGVQFQFPRSKHSDLLQVAPVMDQATDVVVNAIVPEQAIPEAQDVYDRIARESGRGVGAALLGTPVITYLGKATRAALGLEIAAGASSGAGAVTVGELFAGEDGTPSMVGELAGAFLGPGALVTGRAVGQFLLDKSRLARSSLAGIGEDGMKAIVREELRENLLANGDLALRMERLRPEVRKQSRAKGVDFEVALENAAIRELFEERSAAWKLAHATVSDPEIQATTAQILKMPVLQATESAFIQAARTAGGARALERAVQSRQALTSAFARWAEDIPDDAFTVAKRLRLEHQKGGEAAAAGLAEAERRARSVIDELGVPDTPEGISDQAQLLATQFDELREEVLGGLGRAIAREVDPTDQMQMLTGSVQRKIQTALTQGFKIDIENVKLDDLVETVLNYDEAEKVTELLRARQRLGKRLGTLARSTNPDDALKADSVSLTLRVVDDALDNPTLVLNGQPLDALAPQVVRYRELAAAYRREITLFDAGAAKRIDDLQSAAEKGTRTLGTGLSHREFLRPNTTQNAQAAAKSFMQTGARNPEVLQTFERATLGDLLASGDVQKMQRWIDQRSVGLREMPQLRQQMDELVRLRSAVEESVGNVAYFDNVAKYENATVRALLGASPEDALGTLVGKTGPRQVDRLLSDLRHSPDAMNAIRRSVLEQMDLKYTRGLRLDQVQLQKDIGHLERIFRALNSPGHVQRVKALMHLDETMNGLRGPGVPAPPGPQDAPLVIQQMLEEPSGFFNIPRMFGRIRAMKQGRVGTGFQTVEVLNRLFGQKAQAANRKSALELLERALYDEDLMFELFEASTLGRIRTREIPLAWLATAGARAVEEDE